MIITTPALAAAERIRSCCPVTLHRRAEPQPVHGVESRATRTTRVRNRVRDLIAEGFNQKSIAAMLDITEAGVRYHLRAIALEE